MYGVLSSCIMKDYLLKIRLWIVVLCELMYDDMRWRVRLEKLLGVGCVFG